MRYLAQHFQPGEHGSDLVFHQSKVPMAIVTREGEFAECNEAFARFFGYTSTEVIGTSFRKFTHPDDLAGYEKAVNMLLAKEDGKTHYEMDKRYLHKMGSYAVWFRLIVDAVWAKDASGVDSFSHFYAVALPYPNGGRYVREEKQGTVVVRPSVTILELVKDNKLAVTVFLCVLGLLHPKILEFLIALVK